MLLLLTGFLACLVSSAFSQSDGGGYYQSQGQGQQSSGFYQSPVRGAPYAAAAPIPNNAPEAQSGSPASAQGTTGPSGGGYQAPFFPPTGGAFLGIAPICTKVAIGITRLHTLIEPIKALLVGAFVFFAVKNYVIPYLIYYARAVEEDEELERSAGVDPATLNILKTVSRGMCLERIACQLGTKAQEYEITKEVVRAIDATAPERLLSIFRAAATAPAPDKEKSCDVYRCERRRTHKKKYQNTSS